MHTIERPQYGWKICYAFLLCCLIFKESAEEDPIASKQQSKESDKLKRRCPYSLRKLWQADVSSFPFAAAPLIADVNGDSKLDIVAAPFGETITVLEGETGRHLHGSGWPRHNLDKSIHSSPLQFDIDGDGILDLLFITSKGEGLFYNKDAYQLQSFTFQLEPAYVKPRWFESADKSDHKNVHGYVFQRATPDFIPVDPHVFDTPVLHEQRYLVIAVSYFYSDDDYSDDQAGPWGNDAEQKDNYYVTAVAILDLKEMRAGLQDRDRKTGPPAAADFTRIVFLELQQTPVVTLFSPTVADLEADFGLSEIVIGSSSGNVYVLTWAGQHRLGFPQTFASVSGRITAANIDVSPGLELIVTDKAGNVTCLNGVTAKRKWSAMVGGTSFAGSRMVDVNLDGQLDVVLATTEGNVFALNGVTGSVIPNYPYKATKGISGNVLVTKFNLFRGPYDLVYMGSELVHEESKIESIPVIQQVTVQTPDKPGQAQVTVLIFDKHGFSSQDSLHLKFNQLILLDFQWLVLSPFIAMIIILLVNHGFPAKDLLPVTFPFKSK
ncbi:protein defective in exine formation 1-like [Plakobranchus ocellatus]|uniref:Protein defective in exine formation 1-like n=1 Tax=Plakobranchus ocellatus TaxID=259542 RepID=A0AAV4DUS1_9GAST|nr:protein defective in exine formation 1-like [Plakobranchus ocellatus]